MTALTSYRAASHFGLGGSRQDLQAIGNDPVGWVVDQASANHSVEIAGMPDTAVQISRNQSRQQARRQAQRRMSGREDAASVIEDEQRRYRHEIQDALRDTLDLRFEQAINTTAPVKERLAWFWSNHFSVSQAGRQQIISACASFENEAIRSSLDGYFAQMLVKVVSNPVMLLYLDNAQSIGPRSRVGRRRKAGLNENLAREVLELHTLGADGGYTQKDVTALAAILTGWTVGTPQMARLDVKPGQFAFVEAMHEPGAHTLLDKTYKEPGAKQAINALKDLSVHPATARFIATKLVRHFSIDTPALRDIEYLTDYFIKSDGHLPTVHKAVLALTSAWEPANKKLKSPYELVVSTWRGLELPRLSTRREATENVLGTMNHMPFTAPSPAGWPDTNEYWGSPAALKQRIEWGVALGRRLGNRINVMDVASVMLDADTEPVLFRTISRAESPAQGLALLISSPQFQWR
ncbi:MAG: DUF1800 family protein [Pseudomonadales bacterium]